MANRTGHFEGGVEDRIMSVLFGRLAELECCAADGFHVENAIAEVRAVLKILRRRQQAFSERPPARLTGVGELRLVVANAEAVA